MPVKTMTRNKVKLSDKEVISRAESNAYFDNRVDKILSEMSKKFAENSAKLAESAAERDKAIGEMSAEIEALSREVRLANSGFRAASAEIEALSREVRMVNSGFGTIGKRFGELVELIVIPGIRHEMNAHGHKFKYATANKKFYAVIKGEKKRIAEVDLFLHNGIETMAAEVKTSVYREDVDKHLEQLKILRKYETETNIENKKLYGAISGIFIDYYARQYALKNGLYILEILEQEQKLITDVPQKCRVW